MTRLLLTFIVAIAIILNETAAKALFGNSPGSSNSANTGKHRHPLAARCQYGGGYQLSPKTTKELTFYKYAGNSKKCATFTAPNLPKSYGFTSLKECESTCKNAPPGHPLPSRCQNSAAFETSSKDKYATFYKYVENSNQCVPFTAPSLPSNFGFKSMKECEAACKDVYHG